MKQSQLITVLLSFATACAALSSDSNSTTLSPSSTRSENDIAFKYMYHGSMQVVPRMFIDYELGSYNPLKPPSQPHKPLWPLDWTDYVVFGVGAIGIIVAAGGGIGGGGVMVPLLLIFGGFTTTTGVALSNVTVMGGALANFVINFSKRHPHVNRPLIDWDLIMVMEGTTIFGAIFGGYMNKICPSWITGTLLVVLLSQMGWVLLRKGMRMYKKENNEIQAEKDAAKEPLLEEGNTEEPQTKGSKVQAHPLPDALLSVDGKEDDEDAKSRKECLLILKREERKLPWERFGVLLLYFVFAAGGDIWKGEVPCMSVQYWLASLVTVPLIVVVTVVFRYVLVHKNNVKEKFGALHPNDVRWTPSNTVKWPLICTSAGVVAGMFGLGGGVVKAPLMLAMNVLPEVSVATSATMILFTAGTATTVYVSFGAVQEDYGIALGIFGFLLTLIGQYTMYYLVETLGRRSAIVLAMATFMIISGALMAIHVVIIYIDNVQSHVNWFAFYSLCTSAGA
eukprot:TRINITY_DN1900_c0_g1_i2.p1 TRINITY_DN1900_c0_g1~~TRINITY_DN1900_c0_g1_i2.p1  ORF type:complete len:508 (+),score=63.41 TRINITY_DN1900_c0_g1_i2:934-2457(+)